jgi:hypothetical protein
MRTVIDVQQLTPAEHLLWSYGVTQPEHIDLEAIARDRQAIVKYRPLSGCEARLVAGRDAAIISVNSQNRSLGRKRFSLAHEIAHWLCDRHTGSFQCAKSDIGPQNAEAKSVEAHANGYASQLVLPNYLVDPWVAGRVPSMDLANALAKEFSASKSASTIKLIKRSSHVAAVACYYQGKLTWHQRSPQFPSDYWVLGELHHDTEAFALTFGAGNGAITRPRREPANRWLRGPDSERIEVTAQSRKLWDETVLSLMVISSPPRRTK